MKPQMLSIELAPELREFVRQQAESLRCSSEEYVVSTIRAAQKQAAQTRLEQLLLEGVESGEPVVADEAFWERLRNEVRTQIRLPKSA